MVAIWSGLEHGEQNRPRSVCRTHRSLELMALPPAPTADMNEWRQRWRARTKAAARPRSRNRTRTKNKRARPRPAGRCSTPSTGAPTRRSDSATPAILRHLRHCISAGDPSRAHVRTRSAEALGARGLYCGQARTRSRIERYSYPISAYTMRRYTPLVSQSRTRRGWRRRCLNCDELRRLKRFER